VSTTFADSWTRFVSAQVCLGVRFAPVLVGVSLAMRFRWLWVTFRSARASFAQKVTPQYEALRTLRSLFLVQVVRKVRRQLVHFLQVVDVDRLDRPQSVESDAPTACGSFSND
jgi:hypothetical protein